MKLVRRAFYIDTENDKRAGGIADTVMADKSEVVDLALSKGLEQIDNSDVAAVMREINERRLRLVVKGSIKNASAKRRS